MLPKSLILGILFLLISCFGFSQRMKVAVAANFQSTMVELAKDFKAKEGLEMDIIVGSSGNLNNQIRNGAPFDLFLSADLMLPDSLYKDGYSFNAAKVYAMGRLVICSPFTKDLKNWKKTILSKNTQKIAIANPEIAPYGEAAKECLIKNHLWKEIQSNLVIGESIGQVNQYLSNGLVDYGFSSNSFILENKSKPVYWIEIGSDEYRPILQGMVILKTSKGDSYKSALKFYQYLLSLRAKRIMQKFGYRFE